MNVQGCGGNTIVTPGSDDMLVPSHSTGSPPVSVVSPLVSELVSVPVVVSLSDESARTPTEVRAILAVPGDPRDGASMHTALFCALLPVVSSATNPDERRVLPPLPLFGLAADRNTTCMVDDDEVVRCWGEEPLKGWIPQLPTRRLLLRAGAYCLITTADQLICKWDDGGFVMAQRSFGAVRDAALRSDGSICMVTTDGELVCTAEGSAPDRDDWADHALRLRGVSTVAIHRGRHGDLTCAVLSGGELQCHRTCPAREWKTVLRDIAEAAGGDQDGPMCARTIAGEVMCWVPRVERCELAPDRAPIKIEGLGADVVDIDVGLGLGCARHADGGVSCWNTTPGTPDFAHAQRQPGISEARELAVGRHHACVRDRTHAVACWGARHEDQLGDTEAIDLLDEPTLVPGIDDAERLVGNAVETCAILSDRRVACWGRRRLSRGIPAWDGTPELRDELGRVRELVPVGSEGMCALGEQGRVTCWGTPEALAPNTAADAIAGTASDRLVALCVEPRRGIASCRGRYRYKGDVEPFAVQVGPFAKDQLAWLDEVLYRVSPAGASRVERADWNPVARRLGWTTVATRDLFPGSRVASSAFQACLLDPTGRVTCDGGLDGRLLGRPVARPISSGVFMVGGPGEELAVGDAHACVRRSDGRVLCWGSNETFQLGQGSEAGISEEPLLVPGIDDAMAVGAWSDRTCVVHRGGHVSCWGGNVHGVSGAGNGMPTDVPVWTNVGPAASSVARAPGG